MRRFMEITLPLLLAVCLAGCRTHRVAVGRDRQDSVRVETRYRTEYRTDTVTVEVPVERHVAVEADSSHLETEYAVSDALLRGDGRLYHTLENKAQKRKFEVKKEVVYRDSIVYRDRSVKETVEVEKPLTKWQRLQIVGFWVIFAFFAGGVCYRVKEFFKK